MIRCFTTLGVATALLALGATAALAAPGGVDTGGFDIRALEPPIDVTPDQLAAQGTPVYPSPYFYPSPYDRAPTVYHGRSVYHPRHHRDHPRAPVYGPMD
jgi:hypothetical protein